MPGSRERTTRREVFRHKGPGESYGVVRAVLGDGRFRVQVDEAGVGLIVARIRGNMRGRVIIRVDDVVLLDDGAQIIKKYTPEEVGLLERPNVVQNSPQEDTGFDFEAL